MAAQTVTVSGNADAIASGAWRSNDTLTINNGAVITVDTDQGRFWSGITINNGTLRLRNPSTTTGIHFRMGRVTGAATALCTLSSGLASVDILGDWIELGVGNGAAGQTFTSPYNDCVSAVWVETSPASGVYESWGNVTRSFGGTAVTTRFMGLDGYGPDRRGMVFEQTPNPTQHEVFILTNATTVLNSRTITCSSTYGLSPGAHVTGSAMVPANSVVESVISPTQFAININCTGASSAVTLTIYPTLELQLGTQLVFGDGVHGKVVPTGCKVRVPNIMITHVCGTNICNGFVNPMQFLLTSSGNFRADTCLFDMCVNNFTQAQTLELKRVGFVSPQTISKVYGIDIDDIVFCIPPTRHWWVSSRDVFEGGGYGTRANAHYNGWSYLSGSLKNIYTVAATPFIPLTTLGLLYLFYCDGLTVSGIRSITAQVYQLSAYKNAALLCAYVNNSTFDNIESYGLAPLYLTTSSDNKFTNILWGTYARSPHVVHSYHLNAVTVIMNDPATGQPLIDDTTYYVKQVLAAQAVPGAALFDSREYAVVPHRGDTSSYGAFSIWAGNASVVFSWTRRDPTHNSPSYEIFRSLDPAVPTRDAGTRVFTTSTSSVGTATDSTAVNETTYYYVFRKHTSAGVFVDSPVMEATPRALVSLPNLLLRSTDYSNAQWVKSNVTVGASAAYTAGAGYGDLRVNYRTATATLANGTLTNTVTGLSIGLVYTAHIWVIFIPTLASNVVITGSPCRLTFGTAFLDFTATKEMQRFSVQFTATATSHNFVLQINTNGHMVVPCNAQVTQSATPQPDVGTSTAALALVAEPTVVGMRTAARGGAPRNAGIYIQWPSTAASAPFIHISTTKGFTPSDANLVAHGGYLQHLVAFTVSSNRNIVDGIVQSGSGGCVNAPEFLFTGSSSDNVVKNVSIDKACGLLSGAVYNALVDTRLDSNRNVVKNVDVGGWINRWVYSPLLYNDNSANGTVIENIRADFCDSSLLTQNNDMIIKGMSGGNASILDGAVTTPAWVMGSTTDGVNTALTAVFDTHFAEMYHTDTTGALNILFTASTKTSKPYTLTGTAAFSNTGLLYLQTAGDSITYTWPHKIRGVSGFRNVPHKVATNDLGYATSVDIDKLSALLVEFQINTGAGFTEWAEATPAALSALVVSATEGFYLKLRLTARAFFRFQSQTNNFVVGETVRHVAGGGTARIAEVFDYGATGVCAIDTVVGSWTTGTAIVRDSDSQARATLVLVNTFGLGPSFNSYILGLQIHTDVDRTATYPDSVKTITLTGLVPGTDVVVLAAGTSTVITSVDSIPGTTWSYTYETPQLVDIGCIRPGYVPFYLRNWLLADVDSAIPISLTTDRTYVA